MCDRLIIQSSRFRRMGYTHTHTLSLSLSHTYPHTHSGSDRLTVYRGLFVAGDPAWFDRPTVHFDRWSDGHGLANISGSSDAHFY